MLMPSALIPSSARVHASDCAERWRPGFAGVYHSEVFACSREASGAASALALATDALAGAAPSATAEADDRRAVLWVQDKAALRLGGRPYRPGLPRVLRHRLIHVVCEKPEDALFALEEGLRCRDLAAVIGELAGNPRALDFTASRRLTLTAEKHGVPLWLVRLDAAHDLSSARMRWQVTAAPSPRPRWNGDAPGTPAWRAELFRARMHPPGTWILRDDGQHLTADRPFNDDIANADDATSAPYPVGLAFAAGDRSLAAV
jgi:protein ImuA